MKLTVSRVKNPEKVDVAESSDGTNVRLPFLRRHIIGKQPLSREGQAPTLSDGLVHPTVFIVPIDDLGHLDSVAGAKAPVSEHFLHVLV